MSVAEVPAPVVPTGPGSEARRRDPTWWLTAAAGVGQVGALAALLSGSSAVVGAVVAVVAVLIGLWVLVPRGLAAARRQRGLSGFGVLVLAGAVWLEAMLTRLSAWNPGPPPGFQSGLDRGFAPSLSGRLPLLIVVLLAAGGGLVLIADAVRVWLGFAPHQRAPWKELTEPEQRSGGIAWRAIAGVLLVGMAAVLGIGLAGGYVVDSTGLQVVALVLVAVVAAVVVATPVLVGSLMRVDRDKAGSARERERQRFAAHLHDSVLQTLALVQRQAHDPVAVARLARRQEHALRAWMAGQSELVSETLVAALREVVTSVEDEYGVTIEFTAIGDRPLDSSTEELVAAAREALRNAARHADGAAIFVFTASSPDGVEVFVRDEGPGFDPDAVPAERRGIRDAIIGRMAFAGGLATLDSTPGEGTEVALRLKARPSR